MKLLDDGKRIRCRVRIEGTFLGMPWFYEDPQDSDGSQVIWVEENDPSDFWWREGNMACDCNRYEFLPGNLQAIHSGDCGHEIMIDTIIPIEGERLPVLYLNESIPEN